MWKAILSIFANAKNWKSIVAWLMQRFLGRLWSLVLEACQYAEIVGSEQGLTGPQKFEMAYKYIVAKLTPQGRTVPLKVLNALINLAVWLIVDPTSEE